MDYQEEFGRGLAGQGLPADPRALDAWQAGDATRRERERVARANARTPELPDSPLWMPEAPAGPTTAVSPEVASSAVLWGLGLAAFVALAPITLPASAATPFGAAMLMVLGGAHRPPLGRAVGAAFLGLLAYFAITGAILAPRFAELPIERIASVRALLDVLAPHLGAAAMGQLVALAGYAVVAAGGLAGGVPKPGLVARALVAGVIGVPMFVACLLGLASLLGL